MKDAVLSVVTFARISYAIGAFHQYIYIYITTICSLCRSWSWSMIDGH